MRTAFVCTDKGSGPSLVFFGSLWLQDGIPPDRKAVFSRSCSPALHQRVDPERLHHSFCKSPSASGCSPWYLPYGPFFFEDPWTAGDVEDFHLFPVHLLESKCSMDLNHCKHVSQLCFIFHFLLRYPIPVPRIGTCFYLLGLLKSYFIHKMVRNALDFTGTGEVL